MTTEQIQEINPEALICDGLDDAIIGMGERIDLGSVVAYGIDKERVDEMEKRLSDFFR
jgi:hypothetical protein